MSASLDFLGQLEDDERRALEAVATRRSASPGQHVMAAGQVADPALGNPAPLGPTLPIKVDGRGTMDFAATLQPTDNITLSFNVNNLAGGAYRNYRTLNAAGQAYAWQTPFLESVYRAGIRFRF